MLCSLLYPFIRFYGIHTMSECWYNECLLLLTAVLSYLGCWAAAKPNLCRTCLGSSGAPALSERCSSAAPPAQPCRPSSAWWSGTAPWVRFALHCLENCRSADLRSDYVGTKIFKRRKIIFFISLTSTVIIILTAYRSQERPAY